MEIIKYAITQTGTLMLNGGHRVTQTSFMYDGSGNPWRLTQNEADAHLFKDVTHAQRAIAKAVRVSPTDIVEGQLNLQVVPVRMVFGTW